MREALLSAEHRCIGKETVDDRVENKARGDNNENKPKNV